MHRYMRVPVGCQGSILVCDGLAQLCCGKFRVLAQVSARRRGRPEVYQRRRGRVARANLLPRQGASTVSQHSSNLHDGGINVHAYHRARSNPADAHLRRVAHCRHLPCAQAAVSELSTLVPQQQAGRYRHAIAEAASRAPSGRAATPCARRGSSRFSSLEPSTTASTQSPAVWAPRRVRRSPVPRTCIVRWHISLAARRRDVCAYRLCSSPRR